MAIEAFSYSIQAQLRSSAGLEVKRSHVRELLAAAYGFKSFATLHQHHVFVEWPGDQPRPALSDGLLRERCVQLKLNTDRVMTALPPMLAAANIAPIKLSTLFDLIGDNDLQDLPPSLLAALRAAAGAGHSDVHWLLASLYKEASDIEASAYWYAQQQAGKHLSGIEAEWADNERRRLEYTTLHDMHLREAARLGHHHALMELAEQSGDLHGYYTLAASAGDISAMQTLVEEFDQDNPKQRWIWIYLARLLGTDVLASTMRAIHEDGSEYDDDVGGPLFVIGRETLDVPPLDTEADLAAQQAAEALLASITSSPDWDNGDEADAISDDDW